MFEVENYGKMWFQHHGYLPFYRGNPSYYEIIYNITNVSVKRFGILLIWHPLENEFPDVCLSNDT